MAGQKKNARKGRKKSRRRNSAPKSNTAARVAAPRSTAAKRNPSRRRAAAQQNPKRRGTRRRRRNPAGGFSLRNPSGVNIATLALGGLGVALLENYVPSLGAQPGFAGIGIQAGTGFALIKWNRKLPSALQDVASATGSVLLAIAAYKGGKLVFQQYIKPNLPGFLNQLPGSTQPAQGQAGLVSFNPASVGMGGLVSFDPQQVY